VRCWEQQAGAKEIADYEQRGVSVDRKIYFTEDPRLTVRHEIVITERNGAKVSFERQETLDVMAEPRPDASAGLGVVFRVMVNGALNLASPG
jgi:hypothetical protein